MNAPATPQGSALAAFQRDFVQALFGADGLDAAAQPGFAVYRNTVHGGCIDALEANHPVVAELVGREWFRAPAAEYAQRHPPRDVRLMMYGEDFGSFLAGLESAAELPYLPAVARLERLWREAHVAADAPALSAASLQALPPESLPELVLAPHPAARWQWFDQAPALSLWRAHQTDDEVQRNAALEALEWHAEGVLITRPLGQVLVAPADRAACAFLDACAEQAPLPNALAAAAAAAEGNPFDARALLEDLLTAGALRSSDPA